VRPKILIIDLRTHAASTEQDANRQPDPYCIATHLSSYDIELYSIASSDDDRTQSNTLCNLRQERSQFLRCEKVRIELLRCGKPDFICIECSGDIDSGLIRTIVAFLQAVDECIAVPILVSRECEISPAMYKSGTPNVDAVHYGPIDEGFIHVLETFGYRLRKKKANRPRLRQPHVDGR